jgi:hypothetical protein
MTTFRTAMGRHDNAEVGRRSWLRLGGNRWELRSISAIGALVVCCNRTGERFLDIVQLVVFRIAMSAPHGYYEADIDGGND